MAFNYKELVLGQEYADLLQDNLVQVQPQIDRSGLGEELIKNLEIQLDLYTHYLEQANRQRLALVNRNLNENTDANVESERLINSLANLEADRIFITEKILGIESKSNTKKLSKSEIGNRNLKNSDLEKLPIYGGNTLAEAKSLGMVKCEDIYPLLSESQALRLKACRNSLVKATTELKQVLNINMALVENGSRIVSTTVGIMTSVVGRKKNEKMNTYTAKGNVHLGKIQIRNLINRSI